MHELKIFSWVEESIVNKILENSPIEKFIKNTVIFKEWEQSNWKWYVIKEWEIAVLVNQVELTELWKWEVFWEIALLNEEKRNATIVALTDVKLIVLTLDDMVDIINNDENLVNKEIIRRIEENLKMRKDLWIS